MINVSTYYDCPSPKLFDRSETKTGSTAAEGCITLSLLRGMMSVITIIIVAK